METGTAHVLDPLDPVHHEMDSLVHNHHVYKSQCDHRLYYRLRMESI